MPIARRQAPIVVTAISSRGLNPYWKSECGRATIYVGDNLAVLPKIDPEQFHAVVTDPPYGLEFMGKDWDAPWKKAEKLSAQQKRFMELHGIKDAAPKSQGFQEWFQERMGATLRVCRPGAHLLSFGGTRMWHRMACAIEDAGFEIRDTVMWVYGSGMPKGFNIAGLKEDEQWKGWGTTLKPALEPIIMARKILIGSVASNVLENRTGALNIDACRIGTTGTTIKEEIKEKKSTGTGRYNFNTGPEGQVTMEGGGTREHADGRWPANLIHDGSEEVTNLFPQEAGGGKEGKQFTKGIGGEDKVLGGKERSGAMVQTYGDSGSAARFFYTAKANDSDRPHGKKGVQHPTVKPLDLMRYLCRLVCVAGGVVLDPFMGSGSTGCAALAEGMCFVGIEQSEEYADIAVGRLKLALISQGIEG